VAALFSDTTIYPNFVSKRIAGGAIEITYPLSVQMDRVIDGTFRLYLNEILSRNFVHDSSDALDDLSDSGVTEE